MKGLEDELNLPSIQQPLQGQIIDDDYVEEAPESTPDEIVDESMKYVLEARRLALIASQDMLSIAQQSQHPKAYETLNGIIKTLSDIAVAPVDLEMKRQKFKGNEPATTIQQSGNITNQNVFMTTAEMLKSMKAGQAPKQLEDGSSTDSTT